MYIPIKTIVPKIRCIGLNFVFKKKGSNKAVITGNVKSDSIPKATFDNFNA